MHNLPFTYILKFDWSVIILRGFVNSFNLSWGQIYVKGLLQRQSENMRLEKIFQMPTDTKSLRTAWTEILTDDVMSVFGMPLITLYT